MNQIAKKESWRMGETRSLPQKRPIASKLLAVIGIVLVIVGGAAFLHSLGSGGGYWAAALIILGAILLLAALLRGLVAAVR